MKKGIVIFYSNHGSNRFLAKKISEELNCEIEEIKPRLNVQIFLVMGINFGNKRIKADLSVYDKVILCGPIWMGKFVTPLKVFIKKYKQWINQLVFVSCCGSSYKMKDEKFGHGLVFKEVKEMLKDKCIRCEAFPITLVLPEDKVEDPEVVMKTRLTADNFKGEIQERFDGFIEQMKEINEQSNESQ